MVLERLFCDIGVSRNGAFFGFPLNADQQFHIDDDFVTFKVTGRQRLTRGVPEKSATPSAFRDSGSTQKRPPAPLIKFSDAPPSE